MPRVVVPDDVGSSPTPPYNPSYGCEGRVERAEMPRNLKKPVGTRVYECYTTPLTDGSASTHKDERVETIEAFRYAPKIMREADNSALRRAFS